MLINAPGFINVRFAGEARCWADRAVPQRRARTGRLLLLSLLVVTIASCSGRRDAAGLVRQAGGPEPLRNAALQVQQYARPDTEEIVPEVAWPEAFRALAPEFVTVDTEGAWITMDFDPIDSSGLYIVFDKSTEPKDEEPDLTFQPVAPGVYSFYLIVGG